MARFTTIALGLAAEKFPLAMAPGQVVSGPPRLGIFVLSDNAVAGTLEDLLIFLKPVGRRKAIVGSIGSILRPGKAIQMSLQDNRWMPSGCHA